MTKAKDYATIGTMFSQAIERRIVEQAGKVKQDAPAAGTRARKSTNKGKR